MISRWEEEAKSLGAKGLAWIAHRDEGLKGPVAKFLSDAEWAKIRELTSCEPGDLLLCVADATNLRVALRLVIELKQVGRPILLVLNMIDIARRRGIDINLEKLSAELGVPVVTSTAELDAAHQHDQTQATR